MHHYRLTIQYDGSRYKGWQRLGQGENTIQSKVEQVLSDGIGQHVEIIGAGRTDAGVHALEQVAHFKSAVKLDLKKIQKHFNHYLPPDISVLETIEAHPEFHARYDAVEKTYLYQIWNEPHSQPFLRKYSMHVKTKLNIDQMKNAAQYFIGEHDFTAYSNAKSNKKKAVRSVYRVELEERAGLIQIRVNGNGFLYNMVRKMVGTLVEVGLGKKETHEIPEILKAKDRSRTGMQAEPQGLYLEKVSFKVPH